MFCEKATKWSRFYIFLMEIFGEIHHRGSEGRVDTDRQHRGILTTEDTENTEDTEIFFSPQRHEAHKDILTAEVA